MILHNISTECLWKALPAKTRLKTRRPAPHPESAAHIAEALLTEALDEGKRRATLEQRDGIRNARKMRIEELADPHRPTPSRESLSTWIASRNA